MDAPPPDDRDLPPIPGAAPPNARASGSSPEVTDHCRFLTAGGVLSRAEWDALPPAYQGAYAYAGHLVARDRAALLAEEIVALANGPQGGPREAANDHHPLETAARAALGVRA